MHENVRNIRMLYAHVMTASETCINTELLNELPLITSRVRIMFGGAAAINRCGVLKRQHGYALSSEAAAGSSAATAVAVTVELVAVLDGVLQQGLDEDLVDVLLSKVRVVVNDVRERYHPELRRFNEFESLVIRARILAQRQL
jgi:hypothetical protein